MANPLALDVWDLEEYGSPTHLSDWVLALDDLSSAAIALYARFCYRAQQLQQGGNRLTITREWADWASGGRGVEAVEELIMARVLTKVAQYKGGKVRFQEEDYPAAVRDVLDRRAPRSSIASAA